MPPIRLPSVVVSPMTASILSKLGKAALEVLIPLGFWLALWALAAHWVGLAYVLPGPGKVLAVFASLAVTGHFWSTVVLSLGRIFFGILLGAVCGGALALVTAASPWAYRIMAPAVKVVRAVPVASFILLVLLWTGRNWVPVVIAALMVLPVIWSAVGQGLASADPQLVELAKCYRFDRGKTLRLVWLPAVAPALTEGLATAMGLAWKAGVAAEVLCTPKLGLGTSIYRTKLDLETPELFAWTLAVLLLSMLMERVVRRVLNGRGRL